MSHPFLNIGGDLAFPGNYLYNFVAALTAHAGGGQTSALQLIGQQGSVTTVATQGDSVLLPQALPGQVYDLFNGGANAMQVFGKGTDTINSIATATGVSHGVNVQATYICVAAGNWLVQFGLPQQAGLVALPGATDAIPPHVPHTYVVTKAGVDAMTLAAPTTGTDDGLMITVVSSTANAHTITATGLFLCGTASVNLATFANQKGAGLTLMAYQAHWIVISSNGITFS